ICGARGHALELGSQFLEDQLQRVWETARATEAPGIPWLAVLLCAAPFDLALHDAFGHAVGRPVYETYSREYLSADLADLVDSQEGGSSTPIGRGSRKAFRDRYPDHYFPHPAPTLIPVWHLVGCADVIETTDHVTAGSCSQGGRSDQPAGGPEGTCDPSRLDAGHPSSLRDWITSDGLRRLKVKLCGTSHGWDYERIAAVGALATELGVEAISVDFNGTAPNADYVIALLDRLETEEVHSYRLLRYVEQPFAPGARLGAEDIGRLTSRIPVILDEGASSWRDVRDGFELGYSGVALKTCKTQSAAMLSLSWAREHGMDVVVQDLTNPMLAQISHAQLGAHASPGTGVESNAMQFYPAASVHEARVHPGLYRRRNGMLDLSTIKGPGFGYRLAEMQRKLPERAA
ncbi:MAG: hypothetical protein GVY23_04220, partial [Spirochaetes bacterium]|nr:hypothetical protein [Spirochaetota bacterium]